MGLILVLELDDLRAKMDVAENRQWNFREQMDFRNHERLSDDMDDKKSELLQAEVTIEVLGRELLLTDEKLAANDTNLPEKLDDVTNAVVESILDDISQLRAKDVELSVRWTDAYPERAELIETIEEKREDETSWRNTPRSCDPEPHLAISRWDSGFRIGIGEADSPGSDHGPRVANIGYQVA